MRTSGPVGVQREPGQVLVHLHRPRRQLHQDIRREDVRDRKLLRGAHISSGKQFAWGAQIKLLRGAHLSSGKLFAWGAHIS